MSSKKQQQKKQQDQTEPELERSLPASLESERALLGAAFLDELSFHQMLSAGVRPEYFLLDSNRKIFRGMQLLIESKKPIEMILLCEQLKVLGELDLIGGPPYITSLLDGVPDCQGQELTERITAFIEILREKYMRRQAVTLSNRLAACAVDDSEPIKWSLSGAHDDLLRLQGDVSREGFQLGEFSQDVIETIHQQMIADREIIGLPFGIQELDTLTTGIRDGEMVVVGGFPGSGKTAFAVDTIRKIARSGAGVAFFSIEMRKEEILHRLWAQESGILYSKLRNPHNLSTPEFRELRDTWAPHCNSLPIIIDDEAVALGEIIPRAHLYVRRYNVKLIVVDYLQRVHAPGKGEYEVVSAAAVGLTEFGKRTGVPVMALSQLTRPDDKKNTANVVPNMSMLRASGQIEQNAHLILFTHRPEDDQGTPTGEDLIVIGKQRAGLKGRVKAHFDGPVLRWEVRGTPATPTPVQQSFAATTA